LGLGLGLGLGRGYGFHMRRDQNHIKYKKVRASVQIWHKSMKLRHWGWGGGGRGVSFPKCFPFHAHKTFEWLVAFEKYSFKVWFLCTFICFLNSIENHIMIEGIALNKGRVRKPWDQTSQNDTDVGIVTIFWLRGISLVNSFFSLLFVKSGSEDENALAEDQPKNSKIKRSDIFQPEL